MARKLKLYQLLEIKSPAARAGVKQMSSIVWEVGLLIGFGEGNS